MAAPSKLAVLPAGCNTKCRSRGLAQNGCAVSPLEGKDVLIFAKHANIALCLGFASGPNKAYHPREPFQKLLVCQEKLGGAFGAGQFLGVRHDFAVFFKWVATIAQHIVSMYAIFFRNRARFFIHKNTYYTVVKRPPTAPFLAQRGFWVNP